MPTLLQLENGPRLVEAADELVLRARSYAILDRYYRGIHPMNYVTQQFRTRFSNTLAGLADNLCPLVVDTISGRLILDSFTGDQGEATNAEALAVLQRRWRFDGEQQAIHKDAILFGDAYAMVWDDGSGPMMTRQRPWQIAIAYSDEVIGQVDAAIKVVPIGLKGKTRFYRVCVYYPDRLERYTTASKITFAGIKNAALVPDEDVPVEPHAFGRVPVFHWANGVGTGEFGVSELETVIPMQDRLNKAVFDSVVSEEARSYPQRYITGLESSINPITGQRESPLDFLDKVWALENEGAKVGILDPGDSNSVIQTIENTRLEIARLSAVPSYFFSANGQVPSGAALRVMESPLQTKVENRQVMFGNVWEDLLLASTGSEFRAVWRDTSPITLGEKLAAGQQMKALGLPKAYIYQDVLNLDPDEAQALAEQSDAEAQAAADLAAQQMFR